MAPRERNQRVAIRTPQRCDHFDVVTTRTIERIGEGIGIKSDPIDLLREQLDRFDETCIAAQLKQSPVKIKVAVEYRQQIAAVDRSAVLALDVIELVDIAACNGEGQDSNCHDLQFLAYRVDFCHFVRREVAHDRAAVRNSLDDALFLEFEEGEPHVGTVRVELLAEILLDQPLARVVWFYACKLLWPAGLAFFYPRWTVDPAQAWQYLPAVGLLAAAGAALWLATRGRRGPLAALLLFFGTL